MSDEIRVPDTVYGRHGYWTSQLNRAIFICDDGLQLHFVLPQGTSAHPGPFSEVAADLEASLRNAGDLGGAKL